MSPRGNRLGAEAVPAGLLAQEYLGPLWADWLRRLPALAAGLLDDWDLTPDGGALYGYTSLVLPVHTDAGTPAVVKVTFDGDDESLHEALALQHWGGRGTVRLLRADPHRRGLLLERVSTTDLSAVDIELACEVVGGFYSRLHVPALPQLRTVTSYVDRWLTALEAMPPSGPLPRRLVEQTVALGRDLVADPASTGRIVHGDLHYGNVLAAEREPWLVIDPKAMSGDPHYEPAPMLWNRWEEMAASGDLRTALRRRFHTLVDVGGLAEDRARDWVVVRSILNAHWSIQDAARAGRGLSSDERARITLCVTTAKAVQD